MPKIAIIGAGYLQVPLYKKAIELGLETIGIAWSEGAVAQNMCTRFYPISTLEKEKILEICIKEKIDGILTIATDIAVPTITYVASQMGLNGNSIESAKLSTNKFFMRTVFSKNNIKCPQFFEVKNMDQINELILQLTFPVIVKPVDRSGSKGVTKVENKNSLAIAIETAISESLTKSAIVESFIQGSEVSVETISFKGKHYILAITDKVTSGPPHFVELEHHQPSLLPIDIQGLINKETIKALNALEIQNGAAHSEFLISGNDIFITEVGARMGGDFIGSDLVYLSTGYDFLKGVIDVALNKFEEPQIQWHKNSGVLFHSEETPSVKEMIEQKDVKPYVKQCEFSNGNIKPLTQSADRSGYFIYQASKRITGNY